MGPRIRKAVFWQDAPIVREQNHGTHPNTRKDDITAGPLPPGHRLAYINGFRVASLSSDAVVPEPSMMVIGTLFGLGGLVAKRRLRK
jgi:hypothetical protein